MSFYRFASSVANTFINQRTIYSVTFPLLFANGYYRKLQQIEKLDEKLRSELHNTDPLTYTTAMCIAASHHIVLFPYHLYLDAKHKNTESSEYTKHNFIIDFLYN